MAGVGLQDIPLRIPEEWSAAWYSKHIREVLALADVRNALGDGIEITGQPNEVATLSVSEDIKNLILQPFVLATPSALLPNERTLGGLDGISITDNGAGNTIDIGIEEDSITLDKLRDLSSFGVLGNPVDAAGPVQNISANIDGDVLCVQSSEVVFTTTPIWTGIHNWLDGIATTWGTGGDLSILHDGADGTISNGTGNLEITSAGGLTVNGETLAEIAQDAVGTILTDSDTIDFTYDDGVPSITAEVIESYAYEWTANHTWADNAEVRLGTGGDLRLLHDGTDSFIRNDTGALNLNVGVSTVVSLAGSTQYVGVSPANALSAYSAANTYAITTGPLAGVGGLLAVNNTVTTFVGARVGTSLAAPTAVGSGLDAFRIQGLAYDGSDSAVVARIAFTTAEAMSATAHGGRIGLSTVTPATTTLVERVRIGTNVDLLLDNEELRIGAGQDLRLFHDGADSLIRNDTGVLRLQGGANIGLQIATTGALSSAQTAAWSGKHTFSGTGAGAIELANAAPEMRFVDTDAAADTGLWAFAIINGNSWRVFTRTDAGAAGVTGLAMTRSGVDVTDVTLGSATSNSTTTLPGTGALRLSADNKELQIGAAAAGDLVLYHNGTDSVIENNTGNLILRAGGELALEEVTTSTGAVTCTLGTNAPAGVGTTTPTTWMTLLVGGTTYFIPLWT